MKCPVCRDTDLTMTSREGIEIDYCPQCRGVWLDRGELDKIIERSATTSHSTYGSSSGHSQPHYSGKKPLTAKNLLKDIFDF